MALRSAPRQRVPIPQELSVRLTEDEDKLCTLLDDCTRYLRDEKGINTSCRIAGGWVRDKVILPTISSATQTNTHPAIALGVTK